MLLECKDQAAESNGREDDRKSVVRELERERARLQALLRERETLAERQRAARVESEAARKRLALMAEISQFLLASLDYQAAINGLAAMILPALGDGCFMEIEEPDRGRRVAIAHINPRKATLLRKLDESVGLPAIIGRSFATALRTGKPERGGITSRRRQGAQDANPAFELLGETGLRAFMVIPLVTRGRVLGAMVFIVSESDRKYSADDLDLGQHVARRAATAVDNLRLYEEAVQARQAAEEANRLKDEFLATLSHELRTPLNAILGWARMLRAGRLEPVTRDRALAIIERNARAQAQIVEDLLDVSRMVRGSLQLHLQDVDLRAVIETALATARPAAEAKGIALALHLEAFGPLVGDAGRLQQVVWNLLSNAVKFTPPGGRIDVYLERHDGETELRILDTGAGISQQFLPHVFERFRQGDSTTTRVYGGLGLGLAIVRHLVELHGGTVRADSPGVGQGSTFTVRLPLRAPGAARS